MSEEPYEVMGVDFGEFGKVSVFIKELDGGFRALVPVEDREVSEREFANSYGW